MTPDDLRAKYPELFEMRHVNFGAGWLGILDELYGVYMAEGLGPNFSIRDVKNKMGMLSVYLDGGTEKQWKATIDAEMKSREICENCGKPGEIMNPREVGFWLHCLCPDCVHLYTKPPCRMM